MHSIMVGIIINLTNQTIFPQFHVVFDDMFTNIYSKKDHVVPSIW